MRRNIVQVVRFGKKVMFKQTISHSEHHQQQLQQNNNNNTPFFKSLKRTNVILVFGQSFVKVIAKF